MKKYFFILMITLQAFVIKAQNRNEKEPYLTRSLSNESIKNVKVKTSGGSIGVTGVDESQARVEVYITENNYRGNDLSKEEIKKRLNEDYEFNISVDNNKLTASAKPKKNNMNWKNALNISFRVFTPKIISTDLSTSGGSIQLKNISGDQDFSTSGGSLDIGEVGGNIKGRTSGGSIHLSNSKDKIDLQTSGGSIDADNCSGDIKLETSGGSLKLNELKGNIEANTSGGSVNGENISGELITHTSGGSVRLSDLYCSLETSTSGGRIDVEIKELGKYVKIDNSAGNIDLQLPKNKGLDLSLQANKINTETLENFKGSINDDEVDGKLNDGGIPVKVMASAGKINLSFK